MERPSPDGEGVGKPRIWLHAVSVGEVTAAAPIVSALRRDLPEAALIVSTSTETGQDMAQRVVTDASEIIYYPLDFPWVVGRALDRVRPDVFVLVETELWPNFIAACGRRGIRGVMANGRISPRSYRRYVRTRFFWRETLCRIDRLAMISNTDAQRVTAMGALPERFRSWATPNTTASPPGWGRSRRKDRETALPDGGRPGLGRRQHPRGGGSHGPGGLRQAPGRISPHDPRSRSPPHRPGRACPGAGPAAGLSRCPVLFGDPVRRPRAEERVVVVDVIGELFKLYSLATVVFCGGSLVPRGGQNILEAAAWGKVVFYGPSMEDFSDERAMLEEVGAGVTVRNGEELLRGIRELLRNPEARRRREEAARAAVAGNRGAAARHAAVIREVLGPP